MEYATLGQTNLTVSRIAFGCEPLGGTDWGQVDTGDIAAAVRLALELGINLFDTADVYGLGRSERLLSKALGRHRFDVVIATKFGINWEPTPRGGRAVTYKDCRPERVVQALEGSLRRLRLDCIPLYQIHWPDPQVPIEDTIEALLRCRERGKILHLGCSNFSLDGIQRTRASGPLASVQMPFSLLDSGTAATFRECQRVDIATLAYGPLAQGLLAGNQARGTDFGPDDRRSRLPHFRAAPGSATMRAVERVCTMARMNRRSPAEVALRWVLDAPFVSCAIVGIKSVRQLRENASSAGWRLTPAEWQELAGDMPGACAGTESLPELNSIGASATKEVSQESARQ